jgi:hypothetical protein
MMKSTGRRAVVAVVGALLLLWYATSRRQADELPAISKQRKAIVIPVTGSDDITWVAKYLPEYVAIYPVAQKIH